MDVVERTLLAGRYRCDARIAAGGMGVVHRGWDLRLDRAVAVKVLHGHLAAEPDVERRFRAEARHAARVKHPNVVALLDQDEHDGVPFIVMELITGPTLREVLRRRGRLSPPEVVEWLAPVCAGLSAVHRTGLVHRDVKPENLLFDAGGRMRVADFGIARALDASSHTPAGMLLGSVRYMAPEVVLGRPASTASDQYALGIVLFEAVTGQAPLAADDPAVVAMRHAREDVPAPSSVDPAISPALDEVVTVATARAPGARYADLDALLAAARGAVARRSAARHPVTGGPSGPVPAPMPAAARAPVPQRDVRPVPGTVGHGPVARPSVAREPAAGHPVALGRPAGTAEPAAHHPVTRGRTSLLALAAAVCAVLDGLVAFALAPLLGSAALRRITRRPGGLRGAWLAYLAIGVSAVRLLAFLAQRAA